MDAKSQHVLHTIVAKLTQSKSQRNKTYSLANNCIVISPIVVCSVASVGSLAGAPDPCNPRQTLVIAEKIAISCCISHHCFTWFDNNIWMNGFITKGNAMLATTKNKVCKRYFLVSQKRIKVGNDFGWDKNKKKMIR